MGSFFMDIQIFQIIPHSSINQHKKFMTSKYQIRLINSNCQKFKPTFSLVFLTGYKSRIPQGIVFKQTEC